MLKKSGLFLFLLAVLQVSARYKSVELDLNKNVIEDEHTAVSSSSSRIISGWEAQPGQIPYHAALRFVNATGELRQCGGSIVSKEWVISSAFCTVNRILAVVRAGVVSLINPEYIFETTEWYRHPEYNSLTPTVLQPNDISLVKLQRPVVYTKLLQPIRVQSSTDAYRNYAGEQVFASGHGNTGNSGPLSDVLRWVYLSAISNSACASKYASGVFDTTICAQYFNVSSQAICSGDIGGPLVHVGSDGVPTLIGVSYFFSVSCDAKLPSGFTRTGPFLPWFEEVTGIDFDNQQEDDENIDNSNSSSTSIITTPFTSTTTPFTSTTDSGKTDDPDDFTPVESTTAQPDFEESEPDDITPEENTTAQPDFEESEPDEITTEENTTAQPDFEESEPDDITPEENTTAQPEFEESEPDDITTEENTTAQPDFEESEPDDITPEENTTAQPDFEESEPDDITTEENTTAQPDFEESEPDDITPEENTTAQPDFEESEPDDITPEENTTAQPDFEESEPDDITTEENTTAQPDFEESEPDDINPEENTTAPPEDTEEEDDSDSSESNEDDEIGQLLKRLLVNVKVKVKFEKYNMTQAVGNEINIVKH